MIKYLEWDSTFFNKKIGQINIIEGKNYIDYESEIISSGYDLIYVFSKKKIEIKYNNKKLEPIDEKVTYQSLLTGDYQDSNLVDEYNSLILNDELINLAYVSGKYSRFKGDNNFKIEEFQNLYYTWIKNSVERKIADYVFIIKENNLIVAVVTLKIDEIAQIGLIAVDPLFQSKGYGKALIKKCLFVAKENNCKSLKVVTQSQNIQACKFYEKCGFQNLSINQIYHIWI